MIKVPFVDLYAQYLTIQSEIDSAIDRVIKNTSFIGGNEVKSFEDEYAKYFNIKHCIACANGTDSLEILLKAMGVGEGDEVIVPAISWISTSESVSSVGATPVFVDINSDYFTINTNLIEEKITSKTKAIIPVHLYGHPCDMDSIMQIAAKYQLKVIEDCAQSHLAEWNNQLIGTIGHAASFSFYPGKNLGAYGDAGAMITNDDAIAKVARQIANHGQEGKHNHIIEGRNSRLDGLQAAILKAKLPHLKNWTKQRIDIAAKYQSKLNGLNDITIPIVHEKAKHVFHLFVIKTNRREALIKFLEQNNIDTAIHYPTALPFLKCYYNRNFQPNDFPVASVVQSQILSLPMFAEMNPEQTNKVIDTIQKFVEQS
jgi:dTDP-4-amino-4,6-dideoxygalactose transaminase